MKKTNVPTNLVNARVCVTISVDLSRPKEELMKLAPPNEIRHGAWHYFLEEGTVRAVFTDSEGLKCLVELEGARRGQLVDLWASHLTVIAKPSPEPGDFVYLEEESHAALAKEVRRLVGEGWRPAGGVAAVNYEKTVWFYQGMIKEAGE